MSGSCIMDAQIWTILLTAILPVVSGTDTNPRIVGGEQASIKDFPYQASIRHSGSHICGGSILSRSFILTAGHCAQNTQFLYTVHVGTDNLHSFTIPHVVINKMVHENFHLSDIGAPVNDIAILRIFPPLMYGASEKAVKLPRKGQITAPGTMITVTGWGATREGGGASNVLRKVYLPIVPHERCSSAYNDPLDHQICAGYPDSGGKDSCQGDSGGPMVVSGVQIGIVSWGYGCAHKGFPGVYTNVADFRDWITKKTGL